MAVEPIKETINNIKQPDPEFTRYRKHDRAVFKFNLNRVINNLRDRIPSIHKREQEIKKKIINKVGSNYLINIDKGNKTDEYAIPGLKLVKVNDNSLAGILSHELGHVRNKERGEYYESISPSEPMQSSKQAYNAINILREENNANRDAVMLPFVHGGANKKELNRYAKQANLAQNTYNTVYMTNDVPPNLDYHMDDKTKKRFLRLNEDLSYVNRPKVTGHVDLNQYRNKK